MTPIVNGEVSEGSCGAAQREDHRGSDIERRMLLQFGKACCRKRWASNFCKTGEQKTAAEAFSQNQPVAARGINNKNCAAADDSGA